MVTKRKRLKFNLGKREKDWQGHCHLCVFTHLPARIIGSLVVLLHAFSFISLLTAREALAFHPNPEWQRAGKSHLENTACNKTTRFILLHSQYWLRSSPFLFNLWRENKKSHPVLFIFIPCPSWKFLGSTKKEGWFKINILTEGKHGWGFSEC